MNEASSVGDALISFASRWRSAIQFSACCGGVRAKGQYVGRVEAPDAEMAIAEAIRLFNVPEAQHSRLIAQPVE